MKLSEIARLIGAAVEGDANVEIHGVAKIEEAKKGEITFLANPMYEKFAAGTKASALIVSENFKTSRKDIAILRVKDPYVAFVFAMKSLVPQREILASGIHLAAYIAPTATIGKDVRIGAGAVILDNVKVGDKTMILPGSVIEEDVEIGEGSTVYSNVTIYGGCKIGKRVIIHSGTVVGSDGFGFAPKDDGTYEKIHSA